jgi:UPF0755 protein
MDTRKAAIRVAAIGFRVVILVAIVLGLVSLGQTTYRYTRAIFSDAAYEEEPGQTVRINIPEDVSGKRLAEVLEDNGLIEDAKVFWIQMKMSDYEDTVKAGTYELNTSMAPSEIFRALSKQAKEQ